jgi:hypothetical protein
MDEYTEIEGGFRVTGHSAYGKTHVWYFPDLELAKRFAEVAVSDGGGEYRIYQHIGTVRRKPFPTEYIEAPPQSQPEAQTASKAERK